MEFQSGFLITNITELLSWNWSRRTSHFNPSKFVPFYRNFHEDIFIYIYSSRYMMCLDVRQFDEDCNDWLKCLIFMGHYFIRGCIGLPGRKWLNVLWVLRLQQIAFHVRGNSNSRHNGGLMKGDPWTPQYHSAVIVREVQGALNWIPGGPQLNILSLLFFQDGWWIKDILLQIDSVFLRSLICFIISDWSYRAIVLSS